MIAQTIDFPKRDSWERKTPRQLFPREAPHEKSSPLLPARQTTAEIQYEVPAATKLARISIVKQRYVSASSNLRLLTRFLVRRGNVRKFRE